MPQSVPIKIEVVGLAPVQDFINAVNEIAGTTNDPNTATNLRAALQQLYERTKHG